MIRLALVVGFTFLMQAAGAREPFSLTLDGKLPSGRTDHLVLKEAPYSPRPSEPEDDGSRWGIDGGFPRTFVNIFELAIGGKPVKIPRKLFQDLSNTNDVKIDEMGKSVRVRTAGGDAAGSFTAVYVFNVPREIDRTVRSGEMPNQVWEHTVWHDDFYDEACCPNM